MFTIDVLPAQRGDCLWLTYGENGEQHHVLIDAGPQETIPSIVPELERRIVALPGKTSRVELFIVTHVDTDHIQGVVSLLSDHRRVPLFRDVWFNGYQHLGLLGGVDGERLTAALSEHPTRWNKAFDGLAVATSDTGPLPTRKLRGDMTITVLGPTQAALSRLAGEWEKACTKAGIVPGAGAPITKKSWIRDELLGSFDPDLLAETTFSNDTTAPNRSSISVIAEHGNKRVLLLGDADAKSTAHALDRLGPGRHVFDAVKVAHHGSRRNTSLDLLTRIQSKRWIISSNGVQFNHPDPECLARIIVTQNKPTLYFNYDTERIADVKAESGVRYKAVVPKSGSGISLKL
jgi:hypothetical protein